KLRRARPDYTIFHGYVLAPIPEFIEQSRTMGMDTKFMGTFWTMDTTNIMQMKDVADGFMGVVPFNYYYDEEGGPMLDKIREMRPEYQNLPYMQGFLSTMLYVETAKRVLDEGKDLTAKNMKAALNTLKDFDTGGIIGVPITITGNSIPVGRIYKADV